MMYNHQRYGYGDAWFTAKNLTEASTSSVISPTFMDQTDKTSLCSIPSVESQILMVDKAL